MKFLLDTDIPASEIALSYAKLGVLALAAVAVVVAVILIVVGCVRKSKKKKKAAQEETPTA